MRRFCPKGFFAGLGSAQSRLKSTEVYFLLPSALQSCGDMDTGLFLGFPCCVNTVCVEHPQVCALMRPLEARRGWGQEGGPGLGHNEGQRVRMGTYLRDQGSQKELSCSQRLNYPIKCEPAPTYQITHELSYS